MSQPPQTGKHIVSKGTYVMHLVKKAGWGIGSVGLILGTGLVLFTAVCCLIIGCAMIWYQFFRGVTLLVISAGMGGISFALMYATKTTMQKAERLNTSLPFTRAIATALPASQSLVRASEEPVQEPGDVLLRAATAGVEKHEEQLVRAAGHECERK